MEETAIVTGMRTAADKTIVSYELNLSGLATTCHMKFLGKIISSTDSPNSSVDSVQELAGKPERAQLA